MKTKRELFTNAGLALFGEQWQSPLARLLGVSPRTVRRWTAGTQAIPAGVWPQIKAALIRRNAKIIEHLFDIELLT